MDGTQMLRSQIVISQYNIFTHPGRIQHTIEGFLMLINILGVAHQLKITMVQHPAENQQRYFYNVLLPVLLV